MTLSFPNQSRSYDPDRRRVRFWGHDGSLEVSFFVEANALVKLNPRTDSGEDSILAAFDAARSRILEVARRAYSPRQRSFYVLAAADF